MGPTEALVHLAAVLGLSPYIDTLTASERNPLVAVDLKPDGQATFRLLPEGTEVRGVTGYQRTGGIVPRPFRDNAVYTLGVTIPAELKGKPPEKIKRAEERAPLCRQAYADIIEKVVLAHPRAQGVLAFRKFFNRTPRLPKWLTDLMEGASPTFIPFFKNKPVFDAVSEDFTHGDPYREGASEKDGEKQPDVVTGDLVVPSDLCPNRIRGLGSTTGTTLMSTNESTTARHGFVGKGVRHLRSPMGEHTIQTHVGALQWLVDRRKSLVLGSGDPQKSNDGRVQVFFWTASGEPGADDLFHRALTKSMSLEELEQEARAFAKDTDTLCVLGIREGKRLQYVAWHYLPVAEAVENLLSYARTRRREDGSTLTFSDVARACVAFHEAVSQDGVFDFKLCNERSDNHCPTPFLLALLDHVVEGHPFPFAIQTRARLAYASQRDTEIKGAYRHMLNQEALME